MARADRPSGPAGRQPAKSYTPGAMSTESAMEQETGFEGGELVGAELARAEPPGKRSRELGAVQSARADHAPLGGVVFLLDREPPDGWMECLQVAEGDLGYEGPYVSKLNGRALELDYDPERFDERFTGLKVAVANA